jgi:tRNA (guanine37-N1)-methyltransferase
LSGNHEEIRRWRRRAALEKTLKHRPELLKTDSLSGEDREILRELSPQGRATLEKLS